MYPLNRMELAALVGKTIQFTDTVEGMEFGFEPGMIGVVVSAEHNQDPGDFAGDDGVFKLRVDIGGKYLERNEKLMVPNYYDENNQPVLKWNQTKHYPKNHISTNYFTYRTWHERTHHSTEFKVVDVAALTKRDPDMSMSLIDTISVNVDNEKMSDAEFRQFIRNSLPLTIANG